MGSKAKLRLCLLALTLFLATVSVGLGDESESLSSRGGAENGCVNRCEELKGNAEEFAACEKGCGANQRVSPRTEFEVCRLRCQVAEQGPEQQRRCQQLCEERLREREQREGKEDDKDKRRDPEREREEQRRREHEQEERRRREREREHERGRGRPGEEDENQRPPDWRREQERREQERRRREQERRERERRGERDDEDENQRDPDWRREQERREQERRRREQERRERERRGERDDDNENQRDPDWRREQERREQEQRRREQERRERERRGERDDENENQKDPDWRREQERREQERRRREQERRERERRGERDDEDENQRDPDWRREQERREQERRQRGQERRERERRGERDEDDENQRDPDWRREQERREQERRQREQERRERSGERDEDENQRDPDWRKEQERRRREQERREREWEREHGRGRGLDENQRGGQGREEQKREQERREREWEKDRGRWRGRDENQRGGQGREEQRSREEEREREERQREHRHGGRGGANQVEIRRTEQEQSHNPYYFQKHRFQSRFRSDEGHWRVLERFSERSELLRGIKNQRFAILEARPQTFIIPHHLDAETVLLVVRGRATLTTIVQERKETRKESYNLECGDVMTVPAGTTTYLANHENEDLQMVKLIQPVNNPGEFKDYLSSGGESQAYYSVFSNDVLEAALNIPRDRLERIFKQHGERRGKIIRASQEQLRALSQRATSVRRGSRGVRAPIKLESQTPVYSNQYGQMFEASPDEFPQLRRTDVAASVLEIKQSGMMVPHFNSRATWVVFVSEGAGSFEMGCSHLQGGQWQQRGRREEEERHWRREEEEEREGRSGRIERVAGRLSPGGVLVVPAGQPIAIMASPNENLRLVGFGINAENNRRNFLAGKENIMNEVDREAKELAFNVEGKQADQIFRSQRESFFTEGPEGGRRRRSTERSPLQSILKLAGYF